MCLSMRNSVAIPEVSAYKVFTRDAEDRLQSVFAPTFKPGLKYPANQRIRVDAEDASFFAFEQLRDAISITRQGRRRWNMVDGALIVLPVTMYEVVATGKYHVPSDDVQCLDGYYPALEAKELIVHDSDETRNRFYLEIVVDWLNSQKYSIRKVEREAICRLIPQLTLAD